MRKRYMTKFVHQISSQGRTCHLNSLLRWVVLLETEICTPKTFSKSEAFHIAIDCLEENDEETITLTDLFNVMKVKRALTYDDIYSKSYMKQKLTDHDGQKMSITTIRQKQNIITLS